MSLNLDWSECKSEQVKKDPFAYGCMLMSLGINEVTEKNKAEVKLRYKILKAAYGREYFRKVVEDTETGGTKWEEVPFDTDELIGLGSNVGTEPFSRWVNKLKKNVLG